MQKRRRIHTQGLMPMLCAQYPIPDTYVSRYLHPNPISISISGIKSVFVSESVSVFVWVCVCRCVCGCRFLVVVVVGARAGAGAGAAVSAGTAGWNNYVQTAGEMAVWAMFRWWTTHPLPPTHSPMTPPTELHDPPRPLLSNLPPTNWCRTDDSTEGSRPKCVELRCHAVSHPAIQLASHRTTGRHSQIPTAPTYPHTCDTGPNTRGRPWDGDERVSAKTSQELTV